MISRTTSGLALAAVLTMTAQSASAAPACGSTVGGPGQTVVLDGDVGPCAGSALVVADGTVAIDMGGHTVSCIPGSSERYGIDAYSVTNPILIQDGTASGCSMGIGSYTATIENVVVESNVSGFLGAACRNSVARNNVHQGFQLLGGLSSGCEAHDNGQTGIIVNGPVTVRDSEASRNGLDGVLTYQPATLQRVVASENGTEGIVIYGDGRSTVIDCTATGNGARGIRIGGSYRSRVRVQGTRAEGNDGEGFFIQAAFVRFNRNVSTGNAGIGIRLEDNEGGSLIRNDSFDNDQVDMYDDDSCANSRWRHNEFEDSNDPCIR